MGTDSSDLKQLCEKKIQILISEEHVVFIQRHKHEPLQTTAPKNYQITYCMRNEIFFTFGQKMGLEATVPETEKMLTSN